MINSRKRLIIAAILTLAASAVIYTVGFEKPLENKKFFNFPLETGSWQGRELVMSDYVYQGIETKYLFLRDYISSKYREPVNLSIVWFDDKNIAFHTPEACLGGIGINVLKKDKVKINAAGRDMTVGRLVVDLNGRKDIVLYYFDVDGKITLSQSMIRFYTFLKRLTLKRSSASFVRLMATVENDENETMNKMTEFLGDILPVIPDYTYTENISEKARP